MYNVDCTLCPDSESEARQKMWRPCGGGLFRQWSVQRPVSASLGRRLQAEDYLGPPCRALGALGQIHGDERQ